MRYINSRFTYLLTYLLTYILSWHILQVRSLTPASRRQQCMQKPSLQKHARNYVDGANLRPTFYMPTSVQDHPLTPATRDTLIKRKQAETLPTDWQSDVLCPLNTWLGYLRPHYFRPTACLSACRCFCCGWSAALTSHVACLSSSGATVYDIFCDSIISAARTQFAIYRTYCRELTTGTDPVEDHTWQLWDWWTSEVAEVFCRRRHWILLLLLLLLRAFI